MQWQFCYHLNNRSISSSATRERMLAAYACHPCTQSIHWLPKACLAPELFVVRAPVVRLWKFLKERLTGQFVLLHCTIPKAVYFSIWMTVYSVSISWHSFTLIDKAVSLISQAGLLQVSFHSLQGVGCFWAALQTIQCLRNTLQ